MNPDLGLSVEDQKTLIALLDQYVPNEEIWAYGSRVRGTQRPFSDLDLVIHNDKPIDPQRMAELRYALSESNLSIKIDIQEWSHLSPTFQNIVAKDHVLFKSKS